MKRRSKTRYPYSNRMTEAIISRLSDQGYNLVIEGTGRTTDVPIQTATMLQAKGYETKCMSWQYLKSTHI